jgi:hypothetical protein
MEDTIILDISGPRNDRLDHFVAFFENLTDAKKHKCKIEFFL